MSAAAPSLDATGHAPAAGAERSSRYQPQLDGLRGIAILSVLLHHFEVRLPGLFDWGPIGVRIFFLLSGYLITHSLWRLHGDVERAGGGYGKGLLGFHARRLARLVPVLYLMIAVACLMGLPEFRQALGWHLTFLSNFYALHVDKWPDAASHLWSLSVQEQFYLVWPFVILITPRRWLPALLVALVGGAFVFRAAIIATGASDFHRWVMLPGVIDSFALGALIACAGPGWAKSPRFTSGGTGALIGAAAFGCYVAARLVRFGPFPGAWAAVIETLENLFFAWMLLRTVAGWRGVVGMLFENRVLVYLGRISYALYVFHVLVHVAITPWLAHHGLGLHEHMLIRSTILLALSIGIASLSYFFLEMPLAAWVRRRERGLAGARQSMA